MDPIKYIFEKPDVTGRTTRWKMLLTKYHIQYVTQKAIKRSMLADNLAHQPLEEYQPMSFDFPDEDIMLIRYYEIPGPDEELELGARWKLTFDGASNAKVHGIGVVLITPNNGYIPFAARLCFDCTNNVAEYEACIMGLKADIDLRIKTLEVYRDSMLVIYQVKGKWVTRHSNLVPYRNYVLELMKNFKEIASHHIPRE
ncbi:uncharacterized protein LOC127110025 [Lathyrus oleraceus]|uniref:uncharacterized protein LOC127110025 n=1 Tax=Pisum sativum TaxID=3888 RepID=UPI0021D236E2|nr:uncharacterized protein LOC127110025 [Pisum sativum]